MRPFVLGAKVSPLGCSRPLQRAIVDFAADPPFAQARDKLKEHYGFAIGESTIQRITFVMSSDSPASRKTGHSIALRLKTRPRATLLGKLEVPSEEFFACLGQARSHGDRPESRNAQQR